MTARRSLLALFALAVLATAAQAAASDARFLDLNPWSWLPARSTKSASVMDYFFPPSRTPKVSNEFERKPAFSTLDSAKEFPSTDTPPESRQEARATTRKGVSTNKVKQTTPVKASHSTTPKTKNPTKTSSVSTATKPIQRVTTPKSATTVRRNVTTVTNSPINVSTKPHKHYTIYPSSSLLIKGQDTSGVLAPFSSSITKKPVKTSNYADSTTVHTTLSEMVHSTLNEKLGETDITEPMIKGNDASVSSTVVSGLHQTSQSSGGHKMTTSSMDSSTTKVDVNTTEELDSREGYYQLRDKVPTPTNVKINDQTKKETVPLPAGSTSVLAKPTKYHYYPHNQHIYLLPECAIQQVCNAIYVRLNYTQPLCACPSRYRDPCSASLNADDMHTTRLTTDSKKKYAHKAVTLVKTCEAVSEMRECRAPRDWSLLALQNIRTGKSHYLVICRCPENHILEGPMSHDQPTYASVPGIRVYGMMCVRPSGIQLSHASAYNTKYTVSSVQSTTAGYKVDYSQPHFNQEQPMYNRFPSHSYLGPNTYFNRMSRKMRSKRHVRDKDSPPFPWEKVRELIRALAWDKQ